MSDCSPNRHLLAAQGYFELQMFEDALEELEAATRHAPDDLPVTLLRLEIEMARRQWQDALSLAENLCRLDPHEPHFTIHRAYILRELERVEEARSVLLSGPSRLRELGTYHYNLGCYEALLGNREKALELVRLGMDLDPTLRAFAQTDPDLESIRLELPADAAR